MSFRTLTRPEVGLSRSQQAWAIAGLAVLIVVSIIAAANFQQIYNVQKDFFTGSLLSFVGFSFGKALSRDQEQKALELIRTAPTPRVAVALQKEAEEHLHKQGVFEQLSLLRRNVEAAADRLSEYYDSQCRRHDFYKSAQLLRVTLDDLDKTAMNIVSIWQILKPAVNGLGYSIPSTARLALLGVQRDLREAAGRRDQAYEWFATRLDTEAAESAWELFAVMSSDIFKGSRTLDAMLNEYVPFPPGEYSLIVGDYLTAALGRATEFSEAVSSAGVGEPEVFNVMVGDLSKAASVLKRIDLNVPAGNSKAAGDVRSGRIK
jgi:hypothetical protein